MGFIISIEGIAIDPEKVSVVKDWPLPKSVKEIQSFLGFCNFYRCLLEKWGQVICPLTKLIAKGAWYPLEELKIQAFEKAKELLLSDAVRVYYSPYSKTRIEIDASDGVVVGVLTQQQKDGK